MLWTMNYEQPSLSDEIINRAMMLWYGDGAGNTAEENSSVFSLIRMR